MNKFVLLAFGLMIVVFYELSGGADFVPRKAERIAAAEAAAAEKTAEDAARAEAPQTPDVPQAVASDIVARVTLKTVSDEGTETQPALAEPAAPDTGVSDQGGGSPTLISLQESQTLFAQPIDASQRRIPVAPIPELSSDPTPVDIRQVTGSVVNMRDGPGTSFAVVTSLPRGTEVEVLANDGSGWIKLRTTTGEQVGWMAEYLVSEPAG